MKIIRVEAIVVRLPFRNATAHKPWFWGGKEWRTLDHVLIRVDTDDGLTGYGDGFGYQSFLVVKAAVDHVLAPRLVGREIDGVMEALHRGLHLVGGRGGAILFALAGVDVALWDLAAKRAGLPLWQLLGRGYRRDVPTYASLFRYAEPRVVAAVCEAAAGEGYRHVKLHEITAETVEASRAALGDAVEIMLDVNCEWLPEQALAAARQIAPHRPMLLEEPLWPPEDFEALARLMRESGVPLAAGENACTLPEFKTMLRAGAVRYAQPSVCKIGLSETLRVAAETATASAVLMPHSPYFGPGALATLHLLASVEQEIPFERFYCALEGDLYGGALDPVAGRIAVPEGPGLGIDPDPDTIRRFRLYQ